MNKQQRITNIKAAKVPLCGMSYDAKLLAEAEHAHAPAQLMFCSAGVIELSVAEHLFYVPPSNAVWLPSNVPHTAISQSQVSFRSLYFDTKRLKRLPKQIEVISVSPLLRELILKACEFSYDYKTPGVESRITSVIIDQINIAKAQPYSLYLPNDDLIKSAYNFVTTHLDENILVDKVAAHFAMSGKTLNRYFHKVIGMTFEQWRQQIKILQAISLLTCGHSTTAVAQILGYSHDSAFITSFKRVTGKTPKEFRVIKT